MVPHVDPLKSLLIFEFFEHFAALFTHLVPAQTFNLKLTHLGVAKKVERSWYFRWNCHGRRLQALQWFVIRKISHEFFQLHFELVFRLTCAGPVVLYLGMRRVQLCSWSSTAGFRCCTLSPLRPAVVFTCKTLQPFCLYFRNVSASCSAAFSWRTNCSRK